MRQFGGMSAPMAALVLFLVLLLPRSLSRILRIAFRIVGRFPRDYRRALVTGAIPVGRGGVGPHPRDRISLESAGHLAGRQRCPVPHRGVDGRLRHFI